MNLNVLHRAITSIVIAIELLLDLSFTFLLNVMQGKALSFDRDRNEKSEKD